MLASLLSLPALGAPVGAPILQTPDIHGDSLAFSCEGDIWVGDIKTGKAVRMTTDAGLEDAPSFSPDGMRIAFHGEYDGIRGAYVMSSAGDAPKRLTHAMDFRSVTGWTPDGSAVLYRKSSVPTNYEYRTAPIGAGAEKRIPLEFASHVWFGPDPDTYCFTRFNRWYTAWFHYDGGLQNQVWVHKNGAFKQLTHTEGTNEFPVWCGDRIYFANERAGKFTLMSVQADGSGMRSEAPASDVEIRELSTDGTRVVYERGTSLEVFDPKSRSVTAVKMELTSDLIHTRPYLVPAQDSAAAASLSPTAKRVLVETRGQIASLPVGEGEARVWKAVAGARLQLPTMSPDSKKVAFVSDESGEQQVVVSDADGSNEKTVTTGKRQFKSLVWSPDSKWLVTYDNKMQIRALRVETGEDILVHQYWGNWYGPRVSFSPDSKWVTFRAPLPHKDISAVMVFNLDSRQETQVSDGTADDTNAAFSTDGKWIVFVSARHLGVSNDPILNQLNLGPVSTVCLLPLSAATKSPFLLSDPDESAPKAEDKPVEGPTMVELDGLYGRRIELPVGPANIGIVAMVKDRVLYGANGNVNYYDVSAKKGGIVTSAQNFELSKDGSKMLVTGAGGFRVVDTAGSDLPISTGAVSFGNLRLRIEPLAEWKQMFWDGWRLLRDYFYLANMHGNDWTAIGQKYAAFLPSVRSREELDVLLRWMQAELGSSHEYLSPGDRRDIKPRIAPSYLGIDLASDRGHLKIAKIVRGDGFRPNERSPLADPALKVSDGTYLLKVGGAPVLSSIEVGDKLLGRAGQVVSLTINDKPTLTGARTVYVKPVSDERRMRYVDWVAKNRAYVEAASGGRVGYLHLAAMGNEDMSDFVKQYFQQRDKEALIIDDRFNNGGYIQTLVNTVLGAKISGYFNMRDSAEPWSRQGDAFIGPRCCLINEFAISCGEEFPHRFKDLGIGPLIGRRTEGGEVGSSPGWPLVDGGVISVPNYGMFTTKDGWVIEGAGVSPDIDVPSDPNAYVAGRDPQLDAGVKAMLDALKKKPVEWPKQPKDRVRIKK